MVRSVSSLHLRTIGLCSAGVSPAVAQASCPRPLAGAGRSRDSGRDPDRSGQAARTTSSHCRILGKPALHYSVGGISYRVSPGSFFQVSRFLTPELVTSVTGEEQGELALDLFAGVGLFSLPLARRFERVVAAEANPIAASDLKANAEANGLLNLRAAGGTTYDFLRRFAQREPDLVVMDPPRAGVDVGSLKLLAALRPRKIHYLSCSPSTLARDLNFLLRHAYRVHAIELFELFPQTYHIEALAKLAYNGPA